MLYELRKADKTFYLDAVFTITGDTRVYGEFDPATGRVDNFSSSSGGLSSSMVSP